MSYFKALFQIFTLVGLCPVMAIGWTAGVIWSGLRSGFFFGDTYIQDLAGKHKVWTGTVDEG